MNHDVTSLTLSASELPDTLPVAVGGALPSPQAQLFFEQLRAIRRHWVKIAAGVLLVVAATLVFSLREAKTYQSVAVIRVDPQAQTDLVGNGSDTNRSGVDVNLLMATEQAEIVSPAVVDPVIERLHLDQVPEFQLRPGEAGSNDASGVPLEVHNRVTRNISAVRIPNTFLIEIHARSQSPARAADIANALAQELLQHDYATRSAALVNTSQYMNGQIDTLRAKMERSELSLTNFQRDNNIANPDDKFNQMAARLSARADAMEKDLGAVQQLAGDLSLAKSGSLDALAVSDRGTALKPLLDAEKQKRLQLAEVAAVYGSRHFLYQQAVRQLQQVQAAANDERQHIVAQIQHQYDAALVRLQASQSAFEQLRSENNAISAKAVEYNILKQQADSDTKIYDDLLQGVETAEITAGYHAANLRLMGEARPVPIAVSPRVGLNVLLAGLLALCAGLLVAVVSTRLDRTLSTAEGVRQTLGEPVLALLPSAAASDLKQLLTSPDGSGPQRNTAFSEAVLALSSTIRLSAGRRIASLSVTSARPGEGKTTVSVNLAAAFARQGLRTILVDADLRRPAVQNLLPIDNRRGLSSVLRGECSLSEAIVAAPTPNLSLLPAGPTLSDGVTMYAAQLSGLFEQLKSEFDFVLVDCPPLLGFADTLEISPSLDAVVVIVKAGSTLREMVRATLQQLSQVRARTAGIVLNAASARENPYYAGYYQEYYRSSSDEEQTLEEHDVARR